MDTAVQETPDQIIARIEARAERRLTPCGNGHLVSHIWGSGPPLALLHGNFGSWLHWIRNVEALSRRYRVIAIDIPGFGDSDLPPEPYSFASVSRIIADGLLEIAGGEKISIAGFSLGSSTAVETAYTLGEHMRKLVLVSSSRNMDGVTRVMPPPLVQWKTLHSEAERKEAHRQNLAIVMFHNPDRIDELALTIQRKNTERSRLRGSILRKDPTGTQMRVPGMKCEVGFIWAEGDASIGPHMAERPQWIRTYRPDARYAIIADAGHWVAYEQPGRLNQALLELLD